MSGAEPFSWNLRSGNDAVVVPLLPRWTYQRLDEPELLLLGRAPAEREGRTLSLTLARESGLEDVTLRQWQLGVDATASATLREYLVVDLEAGVGQGWDLRRVATYIYADGDGVTLMQWSRLADGLGVTLTLSGSSETFPGWFEAAQMFMSEVVL